MHPCHLPVREGATPLLDDQCVPVEVVLGVLVAQGVQQVLVILGIDRHDCDDEATNNKLQAVSLSASSVCLSVNQIPGS
jgi:hypothetical protein